MLAVSGLSAPKRTCQVACEAERSHGRVDAPGKPCSDLLQQPAVAVGIAERDERAVAAMLGIQTADPAPPKQVGLIRASVHAGVVVEHLADLDAAPEQLFASSPDVGDDQI